MLRNFFVTILVVVISNTALADENSLLVQKYLNSFASRDAAGIFKLINWKGVDKQSRESLKKYIKSGFKGRQIRRIYIEPLAKNTDPSYVQDGKKYQLNLKPTGQLNIVYISNKGKRSSTQLFVGRHKGELMIGSAVVAPESLACSNPESKKNTPC